jgi:hypothetical protein
MKKKTFFWSLPLFLVLLLFGGFISNSYADYSEGDIVSNFTLNDMNGNPVQLYDYDGYVILINLFAYW